MAEHSTEKPSDTVMIIREGGSGMGRAIAAVLALVLIALAAFWLIGTQQQSATDASIAEAARQVGNAAEKVGNAAQDAAKPLDDGSGS